MKRFLAALICLCLAVPVYGATLPLTGAGMPTAGAPACTANLLLHFDGTNGSTTFTDSSPSAHTITTVSGAPALNTGSPKFGTADIFFNSNSGDVIGADGSAQFGFGTGDFTLDVWVNPFIATTAAIIYTTDVNPVIDLYLAGATFVPTFNDGTADRITGTALTSGVWTHVALVRSSGVTTLYEAGVSVGTYTDGNNYAAPTGSYPHMGGQGMVQNGLISSLDELHVIKGTASWTTNFTPPTMAYC